MASVNKVLLIGNIGRDPETRATPSGTNVTSFSLATTERFNKNGEKQEKTEWHNVIAFGKIADVISRYTKKGSPIYVEGKLQTRSWDDKDGMKKYKTEIIALSIQLLGSKNANDNSSGDSSGEYIPPPTDDDLPF